MKLTNLKDYVENNMNEKEYDFVETFYSLVGDYL